MINFIPIFPLNIVVFPGEKLNLHIFEDRYIQLINDCVAEKKTFGIVVVANQKLSDFGTSCSIVEVAKKYDDGKMDIVIDGEKIFNVFEVVKHVPEKKYHGAIVNYLANNLHRKPVMFTKVYEMLKELHRLMKLTKTFKAEEELKSYDIAHHAALSLDEELELLQLLREDQRLEYLKRHLQKIIPTIAALDNLREKIKMNGHFKELKPFKFDI